NVTVPTYKTCLEEISSPLKSAIKGLDLIMWISNSQVSNETKGSLLSFMYAVNRALKGELEKWIAQGPPVGTMLSSNLLCDSGGAFQKRGVDSSAFHTGAGATAEALIGTFIMETFAGVLYARTCEQSGCSEDTIIMFEAVKIATLWYIDKLAKKQPNGNFEGFFTKDELVAVEKFLDRNRSGIIPIRTKSRQLYNDITKGVSLDNQDHDSFSLIEIEAKFKRHFKQLYKIPTSGSVAALEVYINKLTDSSHTEEEKEQIQNALKTIIISAGGVQLDILSHLTKINEHIDKTNKRADKFPKLLNLSKVNQIAIPQIKALSSYNPGANSDTVKSYAELYKEITTLDSIPTTMDITKIGVAVKDNSIHWILKITSEIKNSQALSKEEKICLLETLHNTLQQRNHGIFGPILKQSNYLLKQSIFSIFRYNGFTVGSAVSIVLTIVAKLFIAPVVILGYLVATLAKMISWGIFAALGYYVGKVPTLGNTNTYEGIDWILENSISGVESLPTDSNPTTPTVRELKNLLIKSMKESDELGIKRVMTLLRNSTNLESGLSYYVLSAYDHYEKATGEESSVLIDSLFKYCAINGNNSAELKKEVFDIWNQAVLHYSIRNEIGAEFAELEGCPEGEKENKIRDILRKYKANPDTYIINPNIPSATKTLLQFYKTIALIRELPRYVLARDVGLEVQEPAPDQNQLSNLGESAQGVGSNDGVNNRNDVNSDVNSENEAKAEKITADILGEFMENMKRVMGIGVDKKDSSSRWYDLRLRKESQINFIKFMLIMVGALVVWAIISTIIVTFPPAIPILVIGAFKLSTTAIASSALLFVVDGFRVVIGNGISNSRLVSHHSSSEANQAYGFLGWVSQECSNLSDDPFHRSVLNSNVHHGGLNDEMQRQQTDVLNRLQVALQTKLLPGDKNLDHKLLYLIISSHKIHELCNRLLQQNISGISKQKTQKINQQLFDKQVREIIVSSPVNNEGFYTFLFDLIKHAYKADSEVCDKSGAQEFYKEIFSQINKSVLDTEHKILCSYIFELLWDQGEFSSTSFLQTHRSVLSRERFFLASFLLGGFTAATNISGLPGLEIPNFAGSCGLTGDVSNINSDVIGGICDTLGTLFLYYNCRKIKGDDTDSIGEFKLNFNSHIEDLFQKLNLAENKLGREFFDRYQHLPFFNKLKLKISKYETSQKPSSSAPALPQFI
ncbi:MAG: hypothetical protein QG673_1614, partial [Pseudomonadota bacterium]|nr:hypothetical protein [Pseudomonadota bacterium]